MRNKFMLAILLCTLLIAVFAFSSVATPQAFAATTQAVNVHSPARVCPPTIGYGSSGSVVKKLQRDLNSHINSLKPLVVDGFFGPNTYARVRTWQDLVNIHIDGIVGPQTWHYGGPCCQDTKIG
ncbi:MAG: peptidoglycan-binding protein [Chloroflexota bacterium]|nr:peptidoglycan-binding protein [Chloroflexota bacterium]